LLSALLWGSAADAWAFGVLIPSPGESDDVLPSIEAARFYVGRDTAGTVFQLTEIAYSRPDPAAPLLWVLPLPAADGATVDPQVCRGDEFSLLEQQAGPRLERHRRAYQGGGCTDLSQPTPEVIDVEAWPFDEEADSDVPWAATGPLEGIDDLEALIAAQWPDEFDISDLNNGPLRHYQLNSFHFVLGHLPGAAEQQGRVCLRVQYQPRQPGSSGAGAAFQYLVPLQSGNVPTAPPETEIVLYLQDEGFVPPFAAENSDGERQVAAYAHVIIDPNLIELKGEGSNYPELFRTLVGVPHIDGGSAAYEQPAPTFVVEYSGPVTAPMDWSVTGPWLTRLRGRFTPGQFGSAGDLHLEPTDDTTLVPGVLPLLASTGSAGVWAGLLAAAVGALVCRRRLRPGAGPQE
jgi:hypothetical protein